MFLQCRTVDPSAGEDAGALIITLPNLMLPMEMINKVRKGTKLPFDIHLMTEKPENIIPNTGNGKSLSVFVFVVVSISFTTNYPSKSIGTRMAVGRPTDII